MDQNSSFPLLPPPSGLPAAPPICAAPSFCSRLMYVLLVVFQASIYFSMQDERQACSLEERDVDGFGMQVAKQFLHRALVALCKTKGSGRACEGFTQDSLVYL